jgi:membrane peptidoglycan carboxypeptidase
VLLAASGYLFVLNHRMSRDLLDRQWRTPTTIVSAKTRGVVARLYGRDWRVTTPLKLDEISPAVANAFLAAEDVRFRKHPGVDPIGIARALFTNLRSGGSPRVAAPSTSSW